MKFKPDQITDSKRLVRGEHLLLARTLLRIKYGHFGPRRILMLAGGEPAEEINALRALFRAGCHITCVDVERACLEAAIDAGADEVLEIDIHGWSKGDRHIGARKEIIYPAGLPSDKRFHLIDLDFCGGLNDEVRATVNAYKYLLVDDGILLLTFSYGRDVTEKFVAAARGGDYLNPIHPGVQELIDGGLSEAVVGRVIFAGSNKGIRPESCLFYQGKQMPMCSILFQVGDHGGVLERYWRGTTEHFPPLYFPTFKTIDPIDLETMFQCDALPAIYGSPAERIEAARRSRTALKASATRRENLLHQSGSLFPIGGETRDTEAKNA